MSKKEQPSRIILEVERAVSDLRRGASVLLNCGKFGPMKVTAGEYLPDAEVITDGAHPAVKLMKLAGLLPRAVVEKAEGKNDDLLEVSALAVDHYPVALAGSVEKISEARVPLKGAEDTHIHAFRPRFGHEEHLAAVIGKPHEKDAPLVRIHSSCVTGDIFGSLRCDCGNQLAKAIDIIEAAGGGAVLYMSQEGRGIGIANKLRAYGLQDQGLDTVEANLALGFAADERDFALAAGMLKQLGMKRITLITNNPEKIEALTYYGIEVVGRQPLITATNPHNKEYLCAKARKMRHQL